MKVESWCSFDWLSDEPLEKLVKIKSSRLLEGKDLFDLSMLNPDQAPPRYMLDKLLEASYKSQSHRYAVSRGIRRLREAFAYKYNSTFGINLDPESQVCIGMGTKELLFTLLCLLGKRNQKVLVGAPTYPAYVYAIRSNKLECGFFEIDTNELQIIENIKRELAKGCFNILVLNFPNNPTGQSVSKMFYVELYKLIKEHDIIVINDFVYGEMGIAIKPESLLGCEESMESLIEIYSLSKAYNVPGWRVGSAVGDAKIIKQLSQLKTHVDYGIFLPVQIASAAALSTRQDLVNDTVLTYEKRAQRIVDGLNNLGWQIQLPEVGASIWCKLPNFLKIKDSYKFVEDLLFQHGVFVMPGILYGEKYKDYVRLALVISEEDILEVIDRIECLQNHYLGR